MCLSLVGAAAVCDAGASSDGSARCALVAVVASEGPASRRVKILGDWLTLCYICSSRVAVEIDGAHGVLFHFHGPQKSPLSFSLSFNPLKSLKTAMGGSCNELAWSWRRRPIRLASASDALGAAARLHIIA
jgi:hypothetical protein